jgi:hypothetical protein
VSWWIVFLPQLLYVWVTLFFFSMVIERMPSSTDRARLAWPFWWNILYLLTMILVCLRLSEQTQGSFTAAFTPLFVMFACFVIHTIRLL